MKLLVLGANGRTGQEVMRRALEAGFDVTGFVRSAGKTPDLTHERLRIVIGDPCDPETLGKALQDQDAVISTLGGKWPTRAAMSVYPRSAQAIVKALQKGQTLRIAVVSTGLLFPARKGWERFLRWLLPSVTASAKRMEDILARSGLDATVLRCGFLTSAAQDTYRSAPNALPDHGHTLARPALAQALLDSIWDAGGFRVRGIADP